MTKADVAVLGCGPAGMLVAHAAYMTGATVGIYSLKQKSRIGGAQYLHMAIPELTAPDPDGRVLFVKNGSPETYARKVYGDERAETSWNSFESGWHDIWSMQSAYNELWEGYQSLIIPSPELGYVEVRGILAENDLVLSTIPKRALCSGVGHQFTAQDVWIDMHPGFPILPDSIVYNGSPHDAWYRASSIFGVESAEYGHERPHSVQVRKPLRNDCDCWDDQPDLVMLGRYGRWEKKQLISDAFVGATEALSALL